MKRIFVAAFAVLAIGIAGCGSSGTFTTGTTHTSGFFNMNELAAAIKFEAKRKQPTIKISSVYCVKKAPATAECQGIFQSGQRQNLEVDIAENGQSYIAHEG